VTSCTPGTSNGCGAGQLCITSDALAAGGSIKAGEQAECCTPSSCSTAAPDCHPGEACAAMVTS
jgi:hypothetical protein